MGGIYRKPIHNDQNNFFPLGHFRGLKGDAAATGEGYMDIIHNRSFDPAPIRIEVDSFDPVSGAVSVTVTMYSTTVSLTNENFHIILFENDILPGHTEVTRDIYNDTISLTGAGNTPYSVDIRRSDTPASMIFTPRGH